MGHIGKAEGVFLAGCCALLCSAALSRYKVGPESLRVTQQTDDVTQQAEASLLVAKTHRGERRGAGGSPDEQIAC